MVIDGKDFAVLKLPTVARLFSFFLLVLLFGCGSSRPTGKTEAEVIYKEALELKEDGRYLLAVERLNTIRSKYPYSYYAVYAELLNADILFDQKNYIEAASSYIIFRDFHPQHKKIPYVVWRIAESFYNQLPSTFDRDLSSGIEAIKYYKELIQKYPQSPYTKDAPSRIEVCEKMIEKKNRYIADFYFKTEVYDAARYRYLDILKEFPRPHSPSLRDHAMLRIMEISLKLKTSQDCKKYFNQFKNQFKEVATSDLIAKMKGVYEECIHL